MPTATTARLTTIRATLRAVFQHHAPTDGELRAVAAALAVPYVELWALAGEVVERPRLTREDVEQWLCWGERDNEQRTAGAEPAQTEEGA